MCRASKLLSLSADSSRISFRRRIRLGDTARQCCDCLRLLCSVNVLLSLFAAATAPPLGLHPHNLSLSAGPYPCTAPDRKRRRVGYPIVLSSCCVLVNNYVGYPIVLSSCCVLVNNYHHFSPKNLTHSHTLDFSLRDSLILGHTSRPCGYEGLAPPSRLEPPMPKGVDLLQRRVQSVCAHSTSSESPPRSSPPCCQSGHRRAGVWPALS